MAGVQRLALTHEWIQARAGSEQVFEAIAQAYPRADLFALSHEPGVVLEVDGRPIRTTWLDRPGLRTRRSLTLPLMPLAWRSLGVNAYDAVISSHHAFGHTNRLAAGGIQLSYVHAPARYIWNPEIDSRGAGRLAAPARAALRRVDRSAAQKVDGYAANSSEVARRIEVAWGREATVIHPPVRVDYFASSRGPTPSRAYVLGFGRWIPYKNLHLVIDAASAAGMPVKIAGRGPDRLRIDAAAAVAKVPVQIIESPSDEELRELYRNAAVLVFPTVEDFGMIPVEAQASGTPVVAIRAGGAVETIEDGVSGVLTDSLAVSDLAAGIAAAVGLSAERCRASADRFSEAVFRSRFIDWAAGCGIAPQQ